MIQHVTGDAHDGGARGVEKQGLENAHEAHKTQQPQDLQVACQATVRVVLICQDDQDDLQGMLSLMMTGWGRNAFNFGRACEAKAREEQRSTKKVPLKT